MGPIRRICSSKSASAVDEKHSGERLGSIATNTAVAIVSFFLSLAVAETVSRIWLQDEPRPSEAGGAIQTKAYMIHDPLLGWKPKPNSETILATSEYRTQIKINANGFRGPEAAYAKAANERRILFIGDSFAEGYSVALDERFSELIETHLNVASQSKFDVINMGVAGYSNDQELLQFQHEGINYQPDIVVLLFFDNDVVNNARHRYWRGNKPVFEIAGTELVLTHTPVPPPEEETEPSEESENRPQSEMQKAKKWLHDNSKLYTFMRQALRNNHDLASLAAKFRLTQEEPLTLPEEFRVYASIDNAEMSHAWELTERVIGALDDEVREAGAKLLVAYVPSRAAVYPDDWRATRWKYGLSSEEWNVHRVADQIGEICERGDIPFMDLTSALQIAAVDEAKEGRRVYFRKDSHWTPEGNAHAAQALIRFLDDHLTAELAQGW